MKGVNVFQLNKATMIAAIQEYFDKRYTPALQVNSISMSGDIFFVNVEGVEDGPVSSKN